MRRIAFINEKGGSCKTTLTVNIGAYFVRKHGKRVLIIDLDSQGHAGKSLGLNTYGTKTTIFELLTEKGITIQDAVQKTHIEGLEIIAANKEFSNFPVAVAAHPDRVFKLQKHLRTLQGYDFVLFDSPPSLGLATLNIMLATEEIIIPVSLTYLALDGCAEIVNTVEWVKRTYGAPELRVTLVVPTLYRPTLLARAIIGKLREYFPDKVSHTVIGFNVKIDEAQSHGKTIWEYAPSSPGAEMLTTLSEEVLMRE